LFAFPSFELLPLIYLAWTKCSFKKKIDNKKLKFSQDSDQLSKLIDSTKTKNKTTFNPEILAKLGELSEYKVEL